MMYVTPFVGVWIETFASRAINNGMRSHPSWVCGLKLFFLRQSSVEARVTPFVGVWIETSLFVNHL